MLKVANKLGLSKWQFFLLLECVDNLVMNSKSTHVCNLKKEKVS